MPSLNLVKLVVRWGGFGEEGTLSWHVGGVPSLQTNQDLSDFLSLFDDKMQHDATPGTWQAFQDLLSQSQAVTTLTAYSYVNGHSAAAHQAERAVNYPGRIGDPMTPLQVCVVASLRTGTPGRSFRGRQYFPAGVGTVSYSTAKLPDAKVNAIALLAASMGPIVKEAAQTSFGTNAAYWGVYSRTRDVVTPVSLVVVDNVADIQRRRAKQLVATHVQSQPVNSNP